MGGWDHGDTVARYLLSQCLPGSTTLHLSTYPTAKACWDRLVKKHTAKSVYAQNNLKAAFFEMMCPKGGNVQAFLMDLCYKCEALAATGVRITDKKYQCLL